MQLVMNFYQSPFSSRETCALAFSIRSGSELLCAHMKSRGWGLPAEYFQNPIGVANRFHYEELAVNPGDFVGFLRRVADERSVGNRFAAKFTWDHKNALLAELSAHTGRKLVWSDLFPRCRWIRIRRRNKVAQAVSAWRAAHSGQWRSDRTASVLTLPEYDFFELLRFLQSLLVEDFNWERFFEQEQPESLLVYYEDFVRDRQHQLERIERHLGWPARGPVSEEPTFGIQRDEFSQSIEARFGEDLDRLGDPDHWASREAAWVRWEGFFRRCDWRVVDGVTRGTPGEPCPVS